jgi:hypothetical protein
VDVTVAHLRSFLDVVIVGPPPPRTRAIDP